MCLYRYLYRYLVIISEQRGAVHRSGVRVMRRALMRIAMHQCGTSTSSVRTCKRRRDLRTPIASIHAGALEYYLGYSLFD